MRRDHLLYARAVFAAIALGACAQPNNVVHISDERRIWVVRQAPGNDAEVYRCADGAPAEQPPKPACVRAPMVKEP